MTTENTHKNTVKKAFDVVDASTHPTDRNIETFDLTPEMFQREFDDGVKSDSQGRKPWQDGYNAI